MLVQQWVTHNGHNVVGNLPSYSYQLTWANWGSWDWRDGTARKWSPERRRWAVPGTQMEARGIPNLGFTICTVSCQSSLTGPIRISEAAACQQLSSAYIIVRLLKYSGFPLLLFSPPQGDLLALQWAVVLFLPSAFPLEFGSRSTSEPFLPGECSRVCRNSSLRQKDDIYYLSKY